MYPFYDKDNWRPYVPIVNSRFGMPGMKINFNQTNTPGVLTYYQPGMYRNNSALINSTAN